MKILGIGVDIIENKRIKEAIKNKSFINRVYSVREKKATLFFIKLDCLCSLTL